MNIKLRTQSIFRFFTILVALLVSAHIIQISLYHFDVIKYIKFIDLDIENNLPSFYSSMAIEFCAVLLAVIFWYKKQSGSKESRYWLGLAFIFLFLGFDEATQIHEEFSDIFEEIIDASGFLYFAWVIPYGTVTVIIGLLYWSWLWKLPANTRNGFVIAGVTFLSGAIGFEMISAVYADEHSVYDWRYSIAYTIEETLEMSGIVLFIRALLFYIEQNVGQISLDFMPSKDNS